MKVLHVINAFTGGGAEKLLHDTVIKQKEQGIDVSIFLLSQQNNHYLEAVKSAGVPVYISKGKSLYYPSHISELKKCIDKGCYDIVHVHLFPALYWASIASMFVNSKSKFVYTEHNTHNRRRDKPYFRPIEMFIYRRYKRIFCISNGTEYNLHQWVPHTFNKTRVIHNGINLQEYKAAKPYNKSELFSNIQENDKVIVMVARFNQQKDHETLIKSLNYLDNSYKLILVGTGDKIEDIKNLVHTEALDDRVAFLGFRKDIPQILKTADIFVLSSHWEGFGLSAIEAMASELPVLVSDIKGIRDIVGRKDITFPIGDYMTLARNIESILSYRNTSAELIKYGLKRSEEFSIDSMANHLAADYESLIQK